MRRRSPGKSHLLIGIGTAIAEAGLSVRCTTTSALVNELAEADTGRRLSSVIVCYSKIDLLCLDLCRARDYAEVVPGDGLFRVNTGVSVSA